jgi:LysM repeat protein
MRILLIKFLLFLSGCTCIASEFHTVKKNETLSLIASKYGVSTSALQAFNNISNPNLLFVGKKLKIPGQGIKEVPYKVQKGDSLGGIASRFGVKLSDLANLNNISRPDLIKVGQKIKVPLKGGTYKKPSLLPNSTLSALSSIRPTSGKWKKIILHHSATPVDDALNMHRVHKARGMKNGLAYHFVISNGSRKAYDGEIYIGPRWKGQLDGGHVKKLSLNKTSIGICLIGNFELRAPTAKQLNALEGLCEYLMKRCGIQKSQVTTHKIIHPGHTACPGKFMSLPAILKRLNP